MTPLIRRCDALHQFRQRATREGLWLVLGGLYAWENETFPPVPDPMWTSVPEATVFKRVETMVPVFPDSAGAIFTPDGTYRPVDANSIEDLLVAKAMQLYVGTRVRLADTHLESPTSFRILGLCLGLRQLRDANQASLSAADVLSPGLLVWATTVRPFTLSETEGLDQHTLLHF